MVGRFFEQSAGRDTPPRGGSRLRGGGWTAAGVATMRRALIASGCRIRATRARCCGSASLTACLLVLGTVLLAREEGQKVVVLVEFQGQL